MKARVLIDNITKDSLVSEWGLAIYMEYAGKKILLDTGASGAFSKNAEALGISLADIDYAILSHAHFDHSDGMDAFFAINSKAKFFLRAGSEENCYSKHWIFKKYVGIRRGTLEEYKDRIIFADGDYELFPGVWLIPHKTPNLDVIGKAAKMYVRREKKWFADDFAHEQSLVFDTDKGLVIFNSCSHGGADNIIKEISDTFPEKQIYAMIGGFHLFRSSDAEVRSFARRVKETGIQRVVTGHCTGKRAYGILKEELGPKIEQLYSGMEII